MMVDVDALSRRYRPLIFTHCMIDMDKDQRPTAYEIDTLLSSQSSKLAVPKITLTATPGLS